MKKLVLVPEARFRALSNCEMIKNSSAIMQAINEPEKREMVKSYNAAQSILRNETSKPDDEQMREYNEKIQDFHMYKDKIKAARFTPYPRQPPVNEAIENDRVAKDAVNAMPMSLQSSAQKLIDQLKDNKDVISWTPNGEVSIRGEKIPGSNLIDLISNTIRNTKTTHPTRFPFLKALAEINTPDSMIKNKSALEQFKKIKDSPREMWPIIRPKGIPEHQLKEDELDAEDGKYSPYKPQIKSSSQKKSDKIAWVTTS